MIIQQVDFIHVQDAPVSRCQHTRLEVFFTLLDGFLDIQRADHPVFGGADRQIDKAGTAALGLKFFTPFGPGADFIRPGIRALGIITIRGADDYFNIRQEGSQRTSRGGFTGAAFATNEHTADAGINGVEDQRTFQGSTHVSSSPARR